MKTGVYYHSKIVFGIIAGLLSTVIPGCEEAPEQQIQQALPVVVTLETAGISSTSVVSGGKVLSSGSGPLTSRGVCWNRLGNPTVQDPRTDEGVGVGTFTSIIEVGHKMNLNDRKLYFTIVNKRFCFDSYKNLEENKWYHFVAVVDASGNTGYLNGIEMSDRHYNLGSDSTYTNFFSSVPVQEIFTLGYGRYGMCDDFFYLDGYISDFRIYNRALSAAEVNELSHRLL